MKKINVFRAFVGMIPKFARVSPLTFVIWQVIAVAHGLSYGLIAPITQGFFDQATAFAAQNATLAAVVSGLVLLGLAHVVKQALNGVANFINSMYFRKAEGVLSLEVHAKMSKLAPICFEDTQTLDDINKAVLGKNHAVWFTGTMLIGFNFYLPYFLCMSVYLFHIKPLLVVSLLFVFAPTLLTQVLRTKVFAKAEDQAASVRREFEYYEDCIVGREYFRETRILGAFAFFKGLYTDSLRLLNKLALRASVKSDLAELGMKLLSLGGYVGILMLLLEALLRKEISVGAFAAIFGSVGQMFSLMEELICYNFGAVARDFGRVQNYFRFLHMLERGGTEIDLPDNVEIRLQDVSFSYPGTKQRAVDHVTLTVQPGEIIAVVGENGSGKSTLVRLLTGLYLPDEGEVLYGDVNTKEVSASSLFKRTSAVFQKFQKCQMTLRENIGISDVECSTADENLDTASGQAGIRTDDHSFTMGYDTMLSREFDGVDLSGGQWQRVAIARSFFRHHRFIVLDEPTAAVDPIEETRIYNRFAAIAKGKTALIVTHRLGSVRLADRVFVMKNGQLMEQGTHAELLAGGGEYARLYRSQRQWYHA